MWREVPLQEVINSQVEAPQDKTLWWRREEKWQDHLWVTSHCATTAADGWTPPLSPFPRHWRGFTQQEGASPSPQLLGDFLLPSSWPYNIETASTSAAVNSAAPGTALRHFERTGNGSHDSLPAITQESKRFGNPWTYPTLTLPQSW